jgi:hypothetical protein
MTDPAMTDTDLDEPPPAARVSAIEREVRRHRIMERALRGWSYELIAGAENLTPRRIRQIVRQSLRLRQIDPAGEHVRLQTARLDASLRLAAGRVEDGELGAIDRLLRVLDRLDRYQTKAAALSLDEAAEGAAKSDARLDDLVATAAADKARAAARRGEGQTAARLTPRRRNVRGAPSFDVEAPAEAVRAIAGSGSFGAPFAPVPTLAAAAAFERPESAGAAGPQGASHSPASRWNPATFHALGITIAKTFKTPSKSFKNASNHFQTLPKVSKSFKKLSGPRRRAGMTGRPSDGLGGASRPCRVRRRGPHVSPRRESRLSKRARR